MVLDPSPFPARSACAAAIEERKWGEGGEGRCVQMRWTRRAAGSGGGALSEQQVCGQEKQQATGMRGIIHGGSSMLAGKCGDAHVFMHCCAEFIMF